MSGMLEFDRGATVLVIGLGRSGLASISELRRRGVTVYATDEMAPERLREPIAAARALGAQFVAPADLEPLLGATRTAILSPGVPPTAPVAGIVARAGVAVIGEIELAYRLCAAPIIAVTGTKGKSTTTALIGHLLGAGGFNVRVGGNIGNPLIGEVAGASPDDWIVAEVSSFQLETIRSFKPRIAVLLNIAPDHLDRYHSMDEYAYAKYRIAANQAMTDWFVGNLDDDRVAGLHWRNGDARVAARQLWFTLNGDCRRAAMYVRNDMLTYAPTTGDPRPVPIVATSALPLRGAHNVGNAMAALLAALAAGCTPEQLRSAIASFEPMPHRLQPVTEIDGVLFVDDSKSTNPGATIAALASFDRPIVLIAGGRAKGTPFDELGTAIAHRAKALIALGESADALVRAAGGVETAALADSMDDAVRAARRLAVAGDVVLLSPGCASFDMFASAEARGDCFADAVRSLRENARA